MSKKHNVLEVSAKSTKEQILAAYNEVLTKLNEKQLSTPQEQKKAGGGTKYYQENCQSLTR